MCGINIAIGNPKRVLEMNAKIKHRGIVSNFTIRENIGFGGVRLPIQGLNNKYNTPYQTQKHIILYNGEIYNFKEISKTAECDIQLLEEDFDPAMFDGDFAIVKYDKEKEKIEITTDRFGKKQLYYKYENYISGISSEIKALIISLVLTSTSASLYLACLAFCNCIAMLTSFANGRVLSSESFGKTSLASPLSLVSVKSLLFSSLIISPLG